MSIVKSEIKYIVFASLFSLIWFLVIIPMLIKRGIENSNVYIQFLIFNIGLYLVLQLVLKSMASNNPILSFGKTKVILGLIFLFTAMDILVPPYLVNSKGELLDEVVLKGAGSDFIAGYFATNSLNLSGILVFLFTYILIPFLLLYLSSIMLRNMVSHL